MDPKLKGNKGKAGKGAGLRSNGTPKASGKGKGKGRLGPSRPTVLPPGVNEDATNADWLATIEAVTQAVTQALYTSMPRN